MARISMDKVCQYLQRAGIKAYVEQTGGGTATIYAGTMGTDMRWPAVAGPGWFNGVGFTEAEGDSDDFYIGADDDGESAAIDCRDHNLDTEAAIAAVMIEQVLNGNGMGLDAEDVERVIEEHRYQSLLEDLDE